MNDGERNRHYLIEKMISCYLQRPHSDIELAERLNTDRTNIYKIRTRTLEDMGIPPQPVAGERGKYFLDRKNFPITLRFSPDEAFAIYVAGRRLQQQTRSAQESVASALEKLSDKLRKPLATVLVKSAHQILSQEQDHQQTAILSILRECWLEGRKIQITHRKLHGKPRTYIVSPYHIEPSVWGDALYLLGYSEYHNTIASFKVSRIEAVEPLEKFDVPDTFDAQKMLQHAWGIWQADKEPQTVRLKFNAYTTPRVKETIWHPSQTIKELEDGSCEWQAEVAEPREMLPWIRGWGSDVEVLAPDWMAQYMMGHVQRLARMYQIDSPENGANGRLHLPWGKTSKTSADYHPAIYHMLDVAHVAQQLLSSRANPRWRNVLANALNVAPESLIEWLPWLIALHDIGKLSVPFQALNDFQRSRLEQEGFDFGKYGAEYKMHHTIVGRIVLSPWAKEAFGNNRAFRQVFLDMVAGHHGKYQLVESVSERQWKSLKEGEQWAELRSEAIQFLRQLLLINEPNKWPQPENLSSAIVALNGFTILCDWLGSDEKYFSPQPFMPTAQYVGHSKRKAQARGQDAGFFAPTLSHAPTDFKALFGGWEPRPLQTTVTQISNKILETPTLTIIESLTGEGKTEAALTLAHKIGRLRQTDELYIALPTMATSNAMFKRLQMHLRDNLQINANVSLIHGQAFLVEDDLRVEPLTNEDGEQPASLEWFAPKKRALLAPFGVGTVDQAELAALNVKHNALRLIGLAGKVVVLDEVHAYDTYMTTIIQAMLQWLSALGSSVILLSATLPLSKRRELIQAYTGTKPEEPQNEAYPYLLTINQNGEQVEANPPAAQASKQIELIALNFAEDDAVGKAEWLLGKIANGGVACWITNLVDRAQELFCAIQKLATDDVDLLLLHARFPLKHRQEIEEKILARYGKAEDGKRPFKGIVIGTQVLEQSLDLDFDLMVSDLAPIDLLLQRAGRLHRHPNRQNRSDQHPGAKFFVNAALHPDGSLKIGADKFYTEYILLKSWEAIQSQIRTTGQFDLPNDYRPLIEYVYAETEPAMDSPFRKAWEARRALELKYEDEANSKLSGKPNAKRPFWKNAKFLFNEEEDSAAWINAQTRYIERDSITVIPLEKAENGTARPVDSTLNVKIDAACPRDKQLELLQYSVRLSKPDLVKALRDQPLPSLFTESTLLKRSFPLWMKFDPLQKLWISEDEIPTVTFQANVGLTFTP